MTPQSRRGYVGLATTIMAVGLGACASPAPDVVATQQSQKPEAGVLKPPLVRPCRAGKYRGTFSSVTAGDAAQLSSLTGLISFELLEVPTGEFFKVSGEKLQGSSEQGDTFSADIDSDSSGCREGVFNVKLLNGAYTLAQTQVTFNFIGSVDGSYVAVPQQGYEGFLGKWTAFWVLIPDDPTPIANGMWSATLTESR